jgi:adenylate kinase family enzyme
MRIAIVGNSGSGKSTLAHQLETMYSLAKLDLDTVAWEPDKIAARRDHAVAIADVVKFCDSNQHWVAEGCYASLVQAALQRRPMLVFMEPGVENCLANCRLRPWEPQIQVKGGARRKTRLPALMGERVLRARGRSITRCSSSLV